MALVRLRLSWYISRRVDTAGDIKNPRNRSMLTRGQQNVNNHTPMDFVKCIHSTDRCVRPGFSLSRPKWERTFQADCSSKEPSLELLWTLQCTCRWPQFWPASPLRQVIKIMSSIGVKICRVNFWFRSKCASGQSKLCPRIISNSR